MNCVIAVSLDNVLADVRELERGMDLTKREHDQHKDSKKFTVLKEFLSTAEDKLKKLKQDAKTAEVPDYSFNMY